MNGESHPSSDAVSLSDELASAGVAGVMIAWADNNGILRSRTVPVARLADVASRGVGSTPSTDSRRWSSASRPPTR